MGRKILINHAEPEEIRVAVLEDGVLEDLSIERVAATKYLGNIYKARVVNLEPAIQAAFVDFGGDRNGFLHASDVMPFYADQPEDLTAYERRPHGRHALVQDLLEDGQELVVQVSKDGIGNKGPTLTTYISVPGKYMVLMPSLARVGVSKKIHDDAVRRRLKGMIQELDPPEGMGYIVRTAGADRTKDELARDLGYLISLWDAMVQRVRTSRAPAPIYRESDLVIRTIRDVFTPEVDQVLVDSREVYEKAGEFLEAVMPEYRDRLVLYNRARPLFHGHRVEEQIERIFQHRVPLPSGGHLVIEQTEALVAIDVNSGRYRKEQDLEDTAFKMNLEAIPEICRQLRLRDLGGVIILDLIDMRDPERRRQVEQKLRRELRKDKARVRVAPVSEFGIVELTRQRVRPSLKQEAYVPCRACRGTGYVKSVESMVLKVLRDVRAFVRQRGPRRVEVTVSEDVAIALQNQKRSALLDLERDFDREIVVLGDAGLLPEEVRIST
ncbi:MAG: Rne/Rng family ribonuclease [Planctomycetota bacterium]|jgi:ribonuclease E